MYEHIQGVLFQFPRTNISEIKRNTKKKFKQRISRRNEVSDFFLKCNFQGYLKVNYVFFFFFNRTTLSIFYINRFLYV